jgi:Ni/Co efflux regulator RcnB
MVKERHHDMTSRYTKALLAIAAAGAVAVPAVAQADHGRDDPAGHVRHEHHHFAHHRHHGHHRRADDTVRHVRHRADRDRHDDHGGHGSDDGPDHG